MPNLTALEMLPAIGQTILVKMESLRVSCEVIDVKFAYGRARVQITPITGGGLQWIELQRIVERVPMSALAR